MPEPSGTSRRWKLHSDAYPACSARAAKLARFSGVAQAPDTGAPKPIFMPAGYRRGADEVLLSGGLCVSPGITRLRLGEHAMHTWDVAVSVDPAARVSP